MYRNATEMKIAQLEQKVAFLESLLYPQQDAFKKNLYKAISSIGGKITNKKEYSEQSRSGHTKFHVDVEFTLPAQSKFSNPNKDNIWSVKGVFMDSSDKTGNFDISLFFHSFPLNKWNNRNEKEQYFDATLGASSGIKGIENQMKNFAHFMKQEAPQMEKFAVGRGWIDMHPSEKQRIIKELGMAEAQKHKWLFEDSTLSYED